VELSKNAVERTRLADAGKAGVLSVGYFGSMIYDLVPRLLREFLDPRPHVKVMIERAAKDMQAEAIRDGRMHLRFSREYPEEPGLRVRNIIAEPLFAAIPDGRPLLERAEVRLADLQSEPLVLFPSAPRPSFADEVTRMLVCAGTPSRIGAEVSDVVTALTYVSVARLFAVVLKSATNVAMPGVAYVPLADAPPETLTCIYRATETPTLVRAFLEYLDRTGPEQPPG
jgi:DNA-binding transcriptional LysR family regulator